MKIDLDTKIETVFTRRAVAVLSNHTKYKAGEPPIKAPITTIRELIRLTEAELLREIGSGRVLVNDIKRTLAIFGLSLGYSDTAPKHSPALRLTSAKCIEPWY